MASAIVPVVTWSGRLFLQGIKKNFHKVFSVFQVAALCIRKKNYTMKTRKQRKTNQNGVALPLPLCAMIKQYCKAKGLVIKVWAARTLEKAIEQDQ
jgi:hypothetical protein